MCLAFVLYVGTVIVFFLHNKFKYNITSKPLPHDLEQMTSLNLLPIPIEFNRTHSHFLVEWKFL
jgi:hypothetical protein